MKGTIFLALLPVSIFAGAFNPQMQSYIDSLKQEVLKTQKDFTDFSATRGEKIFTTMHIGKKGKEISCTSCHNLDLKTKGKNIYTNKVLEPLAPSVNKMRLSDVKDVQKWLRRNFNDVYTKEGTALQKGDVLYYINSK